MWMPFEAPSVTKNTKNCPILFNVQSSCLSCLSCPETNIALSEGILVTLDRYKSEGGAAQKSPSVGYRLKEHKR